MLQSHEITGPSKSILEDNINQVINLYGEGKIEETLLKACKLIKKHPEAPSLHNILGVVYSAKGEIKHSVYHLREALKLQPESAVAHYNLGSSLIVSGEYGEAQKILECAVEIAPNYVDAYFNLGSSLQSQGKIEKALGAYEKTITLSPEHHETYFNLGVILHDKGDLDEAVRNYNQVLSIKPNHAKSYYNLATIFLEKKDKNSAIKHYKQAIKIEPNFAEAYYNWGVILQNNNELLAAIANYNQAIAIKPYYVEAHNNLAISLYYKGEIDASIESYIKVLKINPDYTGASYNLVFPLQAIKIKSPSSLLINQSLDAHNVSATKSILIYKLNQGGERSISSLNEALIELSHVEKKKIVENPKFEKNYETKKANLTEKVVSLVCFGRSGTGLVHSLFDGHPEISTLPSIYFSEHFDPSTWNKIIAGGWDEMIDRLIANYEVLFDASRQEAIITKSKKLIEFIGKKEGMTTVGNGRNEVLKVDKVLFRQELRQLMRHYDCLDDITYFKLVHKAYDKVLQDHRDKTLIFYHIHSPDTEALLNFLRSTPNANFLVMVREPIQNCESWLVANKSFLNNDYSSVVNQITSMLFQIDDVVYDRQNSVGVRLEDLKNNPKKTMRALCRWMGIAETETLYEMTAQGKKWWGDGTSADLSEDNIRPFGSGSISRKLGSILSDNDQLIIRTLYYPFSVRFGYAEENLEKFKIDLKAIRPMIDQMFDFEKTIAKRTNTASTDFIKSGPYVYLRSCLIQRWNVLNKFHTYPNMMEPLKINMEETG